MNVFMYVCFQNFKGEHQVAAKAEERGLKRICTGCGVRFYDFLKRPIICPSCSLEFTGEIKVKTRRSRIGVANDDGAEGQIKSATAKKDSFEDTESDEIEEEEEDIISLDDAKALETSDDDDDSDEAVPSVNLDLDDDDDLEDIDVDDDDLGDLDDLDDDDLDDIKDNDDENKND